jgi:hypothetical protein
MNPNRIPRLSSCIRALAAVALSAAASAHASDNIVGLWWGSVERIDCASGATLATFTGMQTFHLGGTMSDTNSQSPVARGPGMGTWERQGNKVVSKFRYLGYAPDGTWIFTAVVNRTITLGPDGNTASGTSETALYNPLGQQIAAGCARDESVRIE